MSDKTDKLVTNHHSSKSASYNNKNDSAVEVLRKNLHKQQQKIKQRKANKDSLTTMCDEEEDDYMDEEDEDLDEQAEEDLPSSVAGDDLKNLLNAFSSGSFNGTSFNENISTMLKLMKNASNTASSTTNNSSLTANSMVDSLSNNFASIASPCNSQTSNRHSSPVSNITTNRADSAAANPLISNSGSNSFAQLSSPVSSNCTTPMSIISTTGTNNIPGRSKIFECKVCKRRFGYKHVLQNHERIHTGEKPFSCEICHKKFTRDHHLKTHYRLHTGEKPFVCEHCDKRFVQIANLRRHLRTHTGEKPYACEVPNCDSRFSDSNQLKAHMLIHRGEKPYKCDKCQGFYRRRHHLIHHKCPMDTANQGKPRRGRRPRAYESQNTLLPMDVHLSGNSLNNSLNNSSSNNSSTNNLNNLSTNSTMNNSMNAINNNSLLDALSIQTANSNNVSSSTKQQQQQQQQALSAVANSNLFNSLANQHADIGQQLNNLLSQAFISAAANDNGSNLVNSSNDNLDDSIKSNKMISNQVALANLMRNNNNKNLQSQQFEQLTRSLNGLNQNTNFNHSNNKSSSNNLASNNLANNLLNNSNLNHSNLVNSIQQQQQLMAAINLNANLNNLNLSNNLSNLNSLSNFGNLNNNLNSLNSLNMNSQLQSLILQNVMQQMAPLDFSSSNSTNNKKPSQNSSSSTLNSNNNNNSSRNQMKASKRENNNNSNALDLSQMNKRQTESDQEELEDKDEEHNTLLNRINQLNPMLLNQQLLQFNNLHKSNEDAMSVEEDCFDSEDKLSNHLNNNNSKKSKNMNKITFTNKSNTFNNNNNNDIMMDCDLTGGQKQAEQALINGNALRKHLQKQQANSKTNSSTTTTSTIVDEHDKEDPLSGLSKEELEMIVRKQLNNNTLTNEMVSGQFDQNAELTNALRNIIPAHLLDKQPKVDSTSIIETLLLQKQQQLNNNNLHLNNLGQQITSNDSDKSSRNHRNQLRRHMDHNANETAATIVANVAK